LEALDHHVADTNVDAAEDDDPIRRLLAERSGTAYESDADSSDDSWESSYSTQDDEEEESSADATLLALFSQERGAGQAAIASEEEEAEAEVEIAVEEPGKAANTHWECPLCGQQSHRVEPACPTCKSVVDLNRLVDMARNEEVDRVSLKRLISDWEEQADSEPTAAICTKLALGYLNLRQSNAALPHLLQAARMDRGNESLAAALEQVSRRPLILVVDDSRTVQRMVLSTLERELFRVQIAEDGLQALAKLNEETPSLILLDITMPRMDGYQVCKVITGNDAFKHIPVVMLSGKDGFFDKVRGRMVGAKDYITKPFEADVLVKSVRKRIETPSK
jgi:twitching motility two-component system response regulator PilG